MGAFLFVRPCAVRDQNPKLLFACSLVRACVVRDQDQKSNHQVTLCVLVGVCLCGA